MDELALELAGLARSGLSLALLLMAEVRRMDARVGALETELAELRAAHR